MVLGSSECHPLAGPRLPGLGLTLLLGVEDHLLPESGRQRPAAALGGSSSLRARLLAGSGWVGPGTPGAVGHEDRSELLPELTEQWLACRASQPAASQEALASASTQFLKAGSSRHPLTTSCPGSSRRRAGWQEGLGGSTSCPRPAEARAGPAATFLLALEYRGQNHLRAGPLR